jgi:hypothetical protein
MITNQLFGPSLPLLYDTPVIKEVHRVISDPEALGFKVLMQEP